MSTLKRPKYGGPARGLNASPDVTVNRQQIDQLRTIFETHPAIIAAMSVLESQLLGGGLQLRVDGETVEVDAELTQHIDECWMPFARDLISAFLIYGYAVIAYETEDLECPTVRSRAMRRVEGILNGKVVGRRRERDAKNADAKSTEGRRGESSGQSSGGSSSSGVRTGSGGSSGDSGKRRRGKSSDTNNMIPLVASPYKYSLTFYTPPNSYQRRYVILKNDPAGVPEEDTDSILVLQNPPDDLGNVNSPMASVHSIIEFINTLVESAASAEVNRSNPMLVTEQQPKDGRDGISVSDSFFDQESQNISRSQTVQENETQARMLKMQLDMCRALNVNPLLLNQGAGSSAAKPGTASVGSSTESIRRNIEMSSRIFALPTNQRIASSVPQAQARPDLQALMRLSIEYICAALGVPSSLVFEGRFSSRSSAHLALLNSTVQRLAKMLDSTLTQAYVDIHGNEDSSRKIELVTVVSPLSSCEEVLALYQGGLADYEIAAPLALNSVGADVNDIAAAMKRHKDAEKEMKEMRQRGELNEATGVGNPGNPNSAGNSVTSGNDGRDSQREQRPSNDASTKSMNEILKVLKRLENQGVSGQDKD